MHSRAAYFPTTSHIMFIENAIVKFCYNTLNGGAILSSPDSSLHDSTIWFTGVFTVYCNCYNQAMQHGGGMYF